MQASGHPSEYAFLAGGGEMGERIRQYNWLQTPLGPPEQWPQSLRSMVSLVLKSKFPMVLFWGENYIQFYNDAYRPSLGEHGKHPTALGQPGPQCWPEIWSSFAQPLFEQIRQTGESVFSEDQFVPIYRNGHQEEAYWTYTYLPVLEEAGQIGGILAIVHETTQKVRTDQHLQQRTAELATANVELNRSNENLQQFAYMASHDLQEPLRKILAFGDLLRQEFAQQLGAGSDYLAKMQVAANRMATLIRDLLDFTRLTIQQPHHQVSLSELVSEVVIDLELVISESDAQISVEHLPTVLGDPTQLRQLLQNLLSNAVKFRRPDLAPMIQISGQLLGANHLPIGVKPSRQTKSYHLIEVKDNGLGFDPQYTDRIFQVFQRLHTKKEYAGTGIGLAICQKVVDNHGGVITASSEPGQGSTFSIYLPI